MINKPTLNFWPELNLFHFLGLGICALLLLSAQGSGCSRKTAKRKIVPATELRTSTFLKKQLEQPKLKNVETLKVRTKIYAENDGQAIEAYGNLIWIRDSVIWLNIKKLGIEAARALITKDSVIVLNRLDQSYNAYSLENLQLEYSLPAGFPLLQHMLLASAWIEPEMLLKADIKDSLHRLSGTNRHLSADYRIEERSFTLRQETFVQQMDSRILTLRFEQFEKLPDAGIFPYIRRIEIFSPDLGTMRLDLEFSDVEVNVPKSYRFAVPAHYDRIK